MEQQRPYCGINTPIDECYPCAFTGKFACISKGLTCPNCGNHGPSKVSVIRWVWDYLGSPGARPFNASKQEEVKHLGSGQVRAVKPIEVQYKSLSL